MDVDGIVWHRKVRIIGLVRSDHQEVGRNRVGTLLILSVVRHEPPIIRLVLGNEEGLPLPSPQRSKAEVGRARDHAEAVLICQEIELGMAWHLPKQSEAEAAVVNALQQLLAASRQGGAYEALDEGLLVGERIREPITRRGGRLFKGRDLAREDAFGAERDLDVIEHLSHVEDRRHACRKGDHLEGLEAFEQTAPGHLARTQDPDIEHLDVRGAGLERKAERLPRPGVDVKQLLHRSLPVPTRSAGT